MRLLGLSFLLASALSYSEAAAKCPLEVPSPFCVFDKTKPEFSQCRLEDRLLYTNTTRKDYVTYTCPVQAGGKPMELVASKGSYRKDYISQTLYEDWDEPFLKFIRKYYEDWTSYVIQMNFRENPVYSIKMPYMKLFDKSKYANLDLYTLQGLHFSGSKQICTVDFGVLGKHFYSQLADPNFKSPASAVKIIVVDLTGESHFLVNGLSMYYRCDHNWANRYLYAVDETLSDSERMIEHRRRSVEADHDEATRKRHLEACAGEIKFKDNKRATTYETRAPLELMTEAEFVDNMNNHLPMDILSDSKLKAFEYLRLRTPDHACPSMESMNEFVEVMLRLHSIAAEEGYMPWFHFHCNAGKGRTTFFMTAYDMLANAHNTSFDVIMARQKVMNDYPKLGLTYTASQIGTIEGEDPVEQAETNSRTKVLQLFYEYCKEIGPVLRRAEPSAPKMFIIPKDVKSALKDEAKAAKEKADAASIVPITVVIASVAFVAALF